MAKSGKKYLIAREQVDPTQLLVSKDAVAKVKTLAFAKFDESVDVNINLGIDATQGDQVVRGSVVLPHGMVVLLKWRSLQGVILLSRP